MVAAGCRQPVSGVSLLGWLLVWVIVCIAYRVACAGCAAACLSVHALTDHHIVCCVCCPVLQMEQSFAMQINMGIAQDGESDEVSIDTQHGQYSVGISDALGRAEISIGLNRDHLILLVRLNKTRHSSLWLAISVLLFFQ